MAVDTVQQDLTIQVDEHLDSRYFSVLDSLLRSHSRRGGSVTQIVAESKGAFPAVVVNRLRRLGLYDSLLKENPQALSRTTSISPELHPLDFEWYFSADSAQELARLLSSYDGDILCLGAPTVAAAIARSRKRVYLADRNPLLQQRFPNEKELVQFMLWDLNEPLPVRRSFPIVFFDAPWYSHSIRLWLWQASRIVEPGGLVFFSIFPPLLRPTAEQERQHILRETQSLGTVDIESGILEYETPLFEREALATCGINMSRNWRYGDLVRLKDPKTTLEVNGITAKNEYEWDTFVINGQVIKLRNPTRGVEGTILEPVDGCRGYIYPTVSLRDSRRSQIDLWTSRNRVARVGQHGVVLNVLRRLADEGFQLHHITDLPILSLLSASEKDTFVSRLRLILDITPEETNVSANNCS